VSPAQKRSTRVGRPPRSSGDRSQPVSSPPPLTTQAMESSMSIEASTPVSRSPSTRFSSSSQVGMCASSLGSTRTRPPASIERFNLMTCRLELPPPTTSRSPLSSGEPLQSVPHCEGLTDEARKLHTTSGVPPRSRATTRSSPSSPPTYNRGYPSGSRVGVARIGREVSSGLSSCSPVSASLKPTLPSRPAVIAQVRPSRSAMSVCELGPAPEPAGS